MCEGSPDQNYLSKKIFLVVVIYKEHKMGRRSSSLGVMAWGGGGGAVGAHRDCVG